jgi:hypothetical protein
MALLVEKHQASQSKFELVDLTTPEPRCDKGLSIISHPSIIDLVTPKPVPVVDLSTPEPDQLVASVVDLSTSEPEQLVPALSVLAHILAMFQCCPLGLQLLTSDLCQCLLNQQLYLRQNLITVEIAYHYITQPECLYCQKWYYIERTLLLKVVIASFARFLRLNVKSLYFWLYRHTIKLDETVSNVYYIYSLFILMLLISLCSLA